MAEGDLRYERLGRRLEGIFEARGGELAGLAVAVVEEGESAFEFARGRRRISAGASSAEGAAGASSAEGPEGDLPLEPDSLLRVASISKPVTAIGAMLLVEEGRLDLEADVSEYLGFPLRNPAWPGIPITAAMLLSHSSSVRDSGGYALPIQYAMRDFALSGIEGFGRLGWAAPIPGRDPAPGRYFAYANLNYGLLATAMERIAGIRFDRYMRERVLRPLGLSGDYDVAALDEAALARLGAIYRRADEAGKRRTSEPWRAQVDDYAGLRPAIGFRALPGTGPEALEAYVPGTNGSIFSPQGGLRASVRDLGRVARLFLAGGELDGRRLLSRRSVELMTRARWTYDPAARNGELYAGLTRAAGLGLCATTASRDELGGDRLLESGGPRMWGHHGDAYGLLGGLLFEPGTGFGFAYLLNGTAVPPESRRGRHSSWFAWEEEIQAAVLEELGHGEPYRTGFAAWKARRGDFASFSLEGFDAEGEVLVLLPGEAPEAGSDEPARRLLARALSPVLELPFAAREFIPSWNAELPPGASLECRLRARDAEGWTPWYSLGTWAEGAIPYGSPGAATVGADGGPASTALPDRSSRGGQSDERASVQTDTLVLRRDAAAVQAELLLMASRKVLAGGAAGAGASEASGGAVATEARPPVVHALGLAWSGPKAAASSRRPSAAPPSPAPAGRFVPPAPGLPPRRRAEVPGVPAYSQMDYPDGGRSWCSPTCLSMIMAYWEGDASPPEARVRRTVEGVYDPAWEGCGNWAFNAAYAGSRGYEAFLLRLSSLDEAEPYLAAGLPLALSVAWDEAKGRPLAGAPVPRSSGHLTLLVGLDEEGRALMREPAAPGAASAPRSYDRRELERRWLEASGGLVYLVAPRGRAIPGLA